MDQCSIDQMCIESMRSRSVLCDPSYSGAYQRSPRCEAFHPSTFHTSVNHFLFLDRSPIESPTVQSYPIPSHWGLSFFVAARLPRLSEIQLPSTCLASIPLPPIPLCVDLCARNTHAEHSRGPLHRDFHRDYPHQESHADAGLFGQLPSPSRSLDAMIVSARARPA
jgi:hypothetical protein